MNSMDDDMKRIVICKFCGRPEYYGEMRWLNGHCMCRSCYRADYYDRTGKPYAWDDLNGPTPTEEDYLAQQAKEDAHVREKG